MEPVISTAVYAPHLVAFGHPRVSLADTDCLRSSQRTLLLITPKISSGKQVFGVARSLQFFVHREALITLFPYSIYAHCGLYYRYHDKTLEDVC